MTEPSGGGVVPSRSMKRAAVTLAMLGLLLLVGAPAPADHVSEPTSPIGSIKLRVYDYPHGITTLTACDGSEVVAWDEARAEVDVEGARPSEHFVVRMAYYDSLPDRQGRLFHYAWTAFWQHQNVPPHTNTGGLWEAAVFNQQLGNVGYEGPGTFEVKVTGQESGNVFTARCSYVVDLP